MYKVFYDKDSEKKFAFYGSYNLKLAEKISALREIHNEKGMVLIMQIEGIVYEILAMRIAQHENDSSNSLPETSLPQRELNIIHELAEKIADNISYDYTLQRLSYESGLS